MNGSTRVYNAGQLTLMPLAGFIICPIVSVLVYRFARRRIPAEQTLKSQAYYFYQMLSAVLLGQFICHTNWTGTKFMALFVAIGYLMAYAVERILWVWNVNPNFVLPLDEEGSDELGLDKNTMEINNVIYADDLTNPRHAEDMYLILVDHKDIRKRQFVLLTLLILVSVSSIMNGFVMVTRPFDDIKGRVSQWATLVCYYANAFALSLVICGAMIHAQFHVIQPFKRRLTWWFGVTIVWCIIYASTSLPSLVGVQILNARKLAANDVIVVFYGFSAGTLLKIQQYFHQRKPGEIEKKDIYIGLVIFAVALAWSSTSFFL